MVLVETYFVFLRNYFLVLVSVEYTTIFRKGLALFPCACVSGTWVFRLRIFLVVGFSDWVFSGDWVFRLGFPWQLGVQTEDFF